MEMGFIGLNSRPWQGDAFPLEALGRNQLPHPCQLLEDACTPWLLASSFIFKGSSVAYSELSPPPPGPSCLSLPLSLNWSSAHWADLDNSG